MRSSRLRSFYSAFFLVTASFVSSLLLFPSDANAVPAFARQTGVECSMCHVGSFGPQLTPFGRDFKLNGYTLGQVKSRLQEISAMAFTGFEHTADNVAQTGSTARFRDNNNIEVDQISLFYAGELFPHVGMLGQATYNGVADQAAWDNTDIRYANNTLLAGKNFVYGVTVNNNPSVQDLWQTTPAWKFPFVGSALAPSPQAGPYMGSLGGTVGGAGVYGMWNDLLYAEITDYASLPDKVQSTVGEHDVSTSDHLTGLDPYWRLALQHTFGQQYVSVGTYGMNSTRYPGDVRTLGTDKIMDAALDATYQFNSADGQHNVSLYGSAMHEHQNLSASHAGSNSTNPSDNLDFYNASASYYYKNTYGVTLSRFAITGSQDAVLYGTTGNGDSVTNSPNSAGWTVQLDATPFGTDKSFGYPNLNARFFVQYTAYDKFDGGSTNYNGAGTNASNNNTWFTGVWFSF